MIARTILDNYNFQELIVQNFSLIRMPQKRQIFSKDDDESNLFQNNQHTPSPAPVAYYPQQEVV